MAKKSKTQMSRQDASRIQSANAKQNAGKTKAGSFPARAQRAAAKSGKK